MKTDGRIREAPQRVTGRCLGRQTELSVTGHGRGKNNKEKEKKAGKARKYLLHAKLIESLCPRVTG